MTGTAGSVLVLTLLVTGCGATPPTAPDAERLQPPADMPPSTPGGPFRSGALVGAGGHLAQGMVTLTVSGTTAVISFAEGFRASAVPDPVLYLGSSADPNFGNALRIGRYASSGAQQIAFTLPAGAATRYLILWCDRFNVPVGYAALR